MSPAVTKPAPLYERIKHHLRTRIAAGDFPTGGKIPSEFELMAQFAASRMTVHRALRELTAEGLLDRIQGAGTFLRKSPPRSALLEIFDIAEDIAGRGNRHSVSLCLLQSIRATADLAACFTVKRGETLFFSRIVHFENDTPIQLEERIVSPAFAPRYLDQNFTAITTNRYLNTIAAPTEVEHIVHAITPDATVQNLLDIGPEPCLRVERRTWTPAGPATLSTLTHPGSRYSLGSRYPLSRLPARPGS
ncbi:MAG: histidine utilization repressor [Acidocella sp.]|nr:histidine utilization repressor [Acidocella sp.]